MCQPYKQRILSLVIGLHGSVTGPIRNEITYKSHKFVIFADVHRLFQQPTQTTTNTVTTNKAHYCVIVWIYKCGIEL